MPEKSENYLISITIIEGRHFAWPNMDSAVVVQIHNQKKCTAIRRNTDCPFYNEYFVFEFVTTLEKLIDKNITLTVIRPRTVCRSKKMLGYISLDIASVWTQPDHQFYHKWAVITAPSSDPSGGTRGYVKVDITVFAKGESPKFPTLDPQETEEIEGNLLLPEGVSTERQRANFIFKVYKGEDINKNKNISNVKKSPEKNTPSSTVEIIFVGLKIKSSLQKNTSSPIWNERIILTELFPPLCQRLKIQLRHVDSLHNIVYAVKYLNLNLISNAGEYGFLPTFGPAYIHFYTKEGYAGRVLFSLETEIQDLNVSVKSIHVESTPPINENLIWKSEQILLFGAIFDVTLIDKKFHDKSISFELSFGNSIAHKYLEGAGEGLSQNCTPAAHPFTETKSYWYLKFGKRKPCVSVLSTWPDFRRRMYNSNIIFKIATELKNRLDEIEALFENEEFRAPSDKIENLLIDLLDFLGNACRKYIDITQSNTTNFSTNLDKERLKLCIREMEEIENASKLIYNPRTKKKSFRKAQKLYRRLQHLVEEPQECWPDIYIWMISGSKRIIYHKILARDIVYSVIEEESGRLCGIIHNVYFEQPQQQKRIKFSYHSTVACKMEIYLWMGLERHKNVCMEMLPAGFALPEELTEESLPTHLIAKEQYEFQCRAHIYQGRFSPGADDTGLCDPFVKVTLNEYSRETKVKSATLNPLWDQMLLFKQIVLYGQKQYIKNHPPTAVVEIFDQDELFKVEFIGRALITPVIKFVEDPYSAPLFPPKLKWCKIIKDDDTIGGTLIAIELLEISGKINENDLKPDNTVLQVPDDIKPTVVKYRLEVLFWGVRDLKKVQLLSITKPKVTLQISDVILNSETLFSAKKNLNFSKPCKATDVNLPIEEEYAPPVTIKMYDCRSFGRYTYAGTHLVGVQQFLYHPLTIEERNKRFLENKVISSDSLNSKADSKVELENIRQTQHEISKKHYPKDTGKKIKFSCKEWFKDLLHSCKNKKNYKKQGKKYSTSESVAIMDVEDLDWWTKYYASLQSDPKKDNENTAKSLTTKTFRLKIYPNELEAQSEFEGLTDLLQNFQIFKGKKTGDETVDEENITGIFKGTFRIYRWPLDDLSYVTTNGLPLNNGIFQDYPLNETLKFVVRIYCVKGIGLRPKDLSGKSDPYICVTMNEQIINDQENYVPKQVNPIFGKCYELHGIFPRDHSVTIAVWDWDLTTADDLIGETKIDIENRFYTRHRAHCGLASEYQEIGYCLWRDQYKPSVILENLCRRNNLDPPEYAENGVKVCFREFIPETPTIDQEVTVTKEIHALAALQRWNELPVVGCRLVPEHVETRSLYHPAKPGVEQGKLQLFVDVFPKTDLPPPKQTDISPRKPIRYELRVIIWNTDDVVLQEDNFFLGEKMSDIYVKGWLIGPDTSQHTDVHYRSLTGEGNFNWRFVFPFDYLSTENKLVIMKKESVFSIDDTEFKIPCRLTLQVWDNDTFSADDFLGIVTLELSRIPRGARSAKKCNLSNMSPEAPTINLFKTKRTRGWWPFHSVDEETKTDVLTGKVEVEFQLVTAEDAEKNSVGLGREEPQPLPKPKRPDSSFSWFRNPLKALKYVICKHYKWKIIKFVIFLLLVFLILMGIYAFPGYTVKRLLGA